MRALAGDAGAAADARARLLWRLLLGLRARAGIAATMANADKLLARFRAAGEGELTDLVTRLERAATHDAEWLALIAAVTVHETFFMRDAAQLALFSLQVLPELIAAASRGDGEPVLRFGSAGCSTGEEAWSMAMLVIEALAAAGEVVEQVEGLVWRRPWRIRITGCDIVPDVLEQARDGRYRGGPVSALRGLPGPYLRFLPETAGQARRVRDDLRPMVSFQCCNLAESPPPGGPFDALFCRNVLIYFSPEARRFALEALQRTVRPQGWLLLGAVDRPTESGDFTAVWGEGAVAYRRNEESKKGLLF